MREIKFRSWANHSMWHVNALACSDGSDSMDLIDDSIGGESNVRDFETKENRVLMQFTGLHDKNGKEIYEADIVQGHKQIGVIKWHRGHYLAEWDSYDSYLWELSEIEVIGNIFENPELLQGKQEKEKDSYLEP